MSSNHYQTARYDVVPEGGAFAVRNLHGRVYRGGMTFVEACALADLYQDEDDHEAAIARFDDEQGNQP